MSTPQSSLKKPKRNPLTPSAGQGRNIPYRYGEDPLLEEVSTRMVKSRLEGTHKGLQAVHDGAPTDLDLMQTMISRIALLEKRIQLQTKEISEKDRRIDVLEEKVRLYQNVSDESARSPNYLRQLETRCLLLQQQISDMEEFLMDYGMIWVGNSTGDDDEDSFTKNILSHESESVWRPESSVAVEQTPNTKFNVDFDLVIENIKDLNVLAREGEAQIAKTKGGARFKIPDPVQLILYANGIVLFDGPFRPFADESTRICLKDIMDGYFPSELQSSYPDGVPFKVIDNRDIIFQPKAGIKAFTGIGQTLGGDQPTGGKDLVIVNQPTSTTSDRVHTESAISGGAKLTMDQFLSHLPTSIIRGGKVIDIRGGIADTLQGKTVENTQGPVTVIETSTMAELKERLSIDETSRPPSGKNITTLRIKDTNNHTYLLKMKFSDTIGDVITYLNELRSPQDQGYTLVSTFPSRVYSNMSESLQDAGLTPNATIHIRLHVKPTV